MTDPVSPLLLYVEDDALIRETMVESLEEAGFKLLVADHGDQAVQLLVAHAADLRGLITDVNLGDGPDGWAIGTTGGTVDDDDEPVVLDLPGPKHELRR